MSRPAIMMAASAAAFALALAACEQNTPGASAPSAPAAPATPAAPRDGIVGDPLVIAITPDDGQSASSAGRRENVVQHGQRIDRTLSFPTDFTHADVRNVHRWTHEFEWAGITQEVLDRGAIVQWVSIDGGVTWRTGVNLPSWTLDVGARVGHLSIGLYILTWGTAKSLAVEYLKAELANNPVMIRLFVLRATGT